MYRNYLFTLLLVCSFFGSWCWSQNPVVPNVGLNDPHIRIWNDTAYLHATHDKSIDNKQFIMEDWWVWSSPDLVNWTHRSTLKPGDTYIGEPFSGCWATDAAYRDGKYYWYFSERNKQSGVVVSNHPVGPWTDPLGRPLLAEEMTPTHEYDMTIFEENGDHFIIFGVWDYYIARLNPDMISLAEPPRKIEIRNPHGPYGKGSTDDKPYLHKYKHKYYLSWGCFYAMSDRLYGPYDYAGTVIDSTSFAPGFDSPTWPNGFLQGRHGSFFEWHNQWYFIYCDISQTGNRYFRDSFLSYLHYKKNGKMAVIRIDGIGVGRYEIMKGPIEAENYFAAEEMEKLEINPGQFSITNLAKSANVYYPNLIANNPVQYILFNLKINHPFSLELFTDKTEENPILIKEFRALQETSGFQTKKIPLSYPINLKNAYIRIKSDHTKAVIIDQITFQTVNN